MSVASIESAKEAYEHGALREKLARYHDDVDVAFRGWNGAWLDPAFREWNLEGFLPRIRVPLLVIQGEDDPYGTIAQIEAIERGASDTTRLLLPKCGHSPHREHPEETLAAMAAFVRGRR